MEGGMFVTLLLIMIDPEMRKLRISSAGHFPPVLRTGKDAVSELPIKRSYPIGVAENTEYQDTEYILNPGDRIVLYTDGVTEALGPKGAFFGKGRLMQAIAHGGDSPDGVLAAVSKAVAAYSAGVPQSDDLTMVCLGVD
jgi:sigma-B regulation protein RsbU (phosphoserine phosphatase)